MKCLVYFYLCLTCYFLNFNYAFMYGVVILSVKFHSLLKNNMPMHSYHGLCADVSVMADIARLMMGWDASYVVLLTCAPWMRNVS